MIVETKRAFTIVCLLVATGALVQAQPAGAADAALRIEAAFDVVEAMQPVEPVSVPMATKGDLPVPLGCIALQADEQAECMDVAYELPSEPSIVMETRFGNTSILTRMNATTVVGGISDEELLPPSE